MRKNKSLAAVALAAAGLILGAACLYTDSPELFTTTISMVTTTPEGSARAKHHPDDHIRRARHQELYRLLRSGVRAN